MSEIIGKLIGKILGKGDDMNRKRDNRVQDLIVPMPTTIILKYIPQMIEDLKVYDLKEGLGRVQEKIAEVKKEDE